jgi:hypothetical protein
MDYVDGDLLSKPRLPEADVEIPGLGVVRVRGLSRAEVLIIQKVADSGEDILERKMLAAAMVSPRRTEGQVREWQEASPVGELQPVVARVMELSGMDEDAAKETYKELASDPDAEFRDVPSGEARDDAGSPADGDVSG